MAPIKLEDNIKEQFKNRSIAPSAKAWNALATKLDSAHSKKRNTKVWWIAAASVVGLVLIGSLLFMNTNQEGQDSLVDVPESNEQLKDLESQDAIIKDPASIENQDVIAQENTTKVINSDTNGQDVVQVKNNKAALANQDAPKKEDPKVVQELIELPKVDAVTQERIANATQTPINTLNPDPLDTKVLEVVAAINAMEQNNKTITEAEIDALLIAAQQDLRATQIVDPLTQKVDPTALLLDVEFELERSFRNKVFDALGDGYKKIRTAVAERNN